VYSVSQTLVFAVRLNYLSAYSVISSVAALDLPILSLSDCANAWPAVLVDGCEVLEALNVNERVFTLGVSGLIAYWVSYSSFDQYLH
jgi:hypothetical protein